MRLGHHTAMASPGLLFWMGVAAALGTPGASAQDHDVAVVGVWADAFTASECETTVYATLYFAGTRDFELESGDVVVTFEYDQDASGQWTPFGDLVVVRAESDVPFSVGMVWPTHFESNPNNGVTFLAPLAGDYRFRATANLPEGMVDSWPANNVRETAVSYSLNVTCIDEPILSDYCYWSSTARESIRCVDAVKVELAANIIKAWECSGERALPWCDGGALDICHLVECPLLASEEIEVLFDDRYNRLSVAIITAAGEKVADMERLREPVRENGQIYTQHMRFQASPRNTYYVAFWAPQGMRFNVNLPFTLHIRRGPRMEMR